MYNLILKIDLFIINFSNMAVYFKKISSYYKKKLYL